ncbi:hypothetical protein N7540_004231 [Penicillium herquei]|nr:hypothetical protein N7540_004231 [Penicillium herquei]
MAGKYGNPIAHPVKIPSWRMLVDHGAITQDVLNYEYQGSGTDEDPFAVTWIPNDTRDPHCFSFSRKICITLVAASSTLIVSLASSAYSGSLDEIIADFNTPYIH